MARILFVDDDPFTLETLMHAVELFGHQAILASTGEDARAIAHEQKPDLIIVDMMLSDMEGVDLVQSLHDCDETSQIPMLMLSASPELDATERAKAAGARAYINKPVRLQALLDTIQKYAAK
jgi:DNA-binding response OmpR family regulator